MEHQIVLPDLHFMIVRDDHTESVEYFGSNQEWFPDAWQRMAGCAPSVTANIFLYHYQKEEAEQYCSKKDLLALMEETWNYVTPGEGGLPSTTKFAEKVKDFGLSHNLELDSKILKIPEDKALRPALDEMIDFIVAALEQETPVAFLNLCNGEVETLDKWHWVTITGLKYDKEAATATAMISDEAVSKEIDMALWLSSTTIGGGFVYFLLDEKLMQSRVQSSTEREI
ncbi:MAG: hypothetical protein PHR78_02675 [Eubacteriales bacterium]|nr:hypothetical protein [Eubacteriales bacterium]MDD4323948.1 hypothetical protein [Eubacteriales bacterium]MDD4541057.1 hypothetical protein [Eubacteriales bacterium]